MSNILTPEQEQQINMFRHDLAAVETVDQMFPPDEAGDAEILHPRWPITPTSEQLCLAAVYDLSTRRAVQSTVLSGESGSLTTRARHLATI